MTFRFTARTVSESERQSFNDTAYYASKGVFATTHQIIADERLVDTDRFGVSRHTHGYEGQVQFSAMRWAESDRLQRLIETNRVQPLAKLLK